MKKMRTSIYIALGCGALYLPSAAVAGGFQVTELCARCSGSRFAGQGAQASGPATVWFNPAGMTKLDDVQLDFSLHYVSANVEFVNLNSTKTNGEPAEGNPVANGAKDAVIPNFYVTWRIDDRWAVGLGINAPYGSETEYDDDWVGRYHALRSAFTTANINPSFAYKVNDWFSIGAGLNAMLIDVELTNALDVGSIVNYAYGGGGSDSGLTTVSDPANDGFSSVTGKNWGWGWNVGALFNFNEHWTLLAGALWTHWKSSFAKVEMDLDVTYTFGFGLALDFAYSHVVLDDLELSEQEVFTEQAGGILAEQLPGADPSKLQGVSNTLNVEYNDSGADIFSLGVRYIF